MTNKEKKYLDYIDERVYYCLQQGIDKKQIAEWLDDAIYDLSDDNSSELFNILYRIQDNGIGILGLIVSIFILYLFSKKLICSFVA